MASLSATAWGIRHAGVNTGRPKMVLVSHGSRANNRQVKTSSVGQLHD